MLVQLFLHLFTSGHPSRDWSIAEALLFLRLSDVILKTKKLVKDIYSKRSEVLEKHSKEYSFCNLLHHRQSEISSKKFIFTKVYFINYLYTVSIYSLLAEPDV